MGRPGPALMVRGEPGIGKTALLDFAAACRPGPGVAAGSPRVIRVRGSEPEASLPFVALADVLRPLVGRAHRLPTPQQDAIEACLGRGGVTGPPTPDPCVLCLAALDVLTEAGEDGRVVVLVDDLQWVDPASRRALVFVARRLVADRVVMILAERTGPQPAAPADGLPVLDVEALTDAACGELLRRDGTELAAPVLDRLCCLSRGNVLVLREVARCLTPAQRRGLAPVPDTFPLGPAIDGAWLGPIDDLPAVTADALAILAASRTAAVADLQAALAQGGLTLRALTPAEEIGLVVTTPDSYDFRHPIVRPLILGRLSPERRLRALDALASAATGTMRTWYRAAGVLGPDDDIARALARAADEARRGTAYDAAALASRRAAELSSTPDAVTANLHLAALDAFQAGKGADAVACCDEALRACADPLARADIELLRGRILTWIGLPTRARDVLVAAAGDVEALDPARAGQLLVESGYPSLVSARVGEGRRRVEAGLRLCATAGNPAAECVATLGILTLATGDVAAGVDHLDSVADALRQVDLESGSIMLALTGWGQCHADRPDAASHGVSRVIESSRGQTSPLGLAFALAVRSEVERWAGRFPAAYVDGVEAVRCADELGQVAALGYALACVARVEALRGDLEGCRRSVERATRELDWYDLGGMGIFVPAIEGFVCLSSGDFDAAVVHLEHAHAAVADAGIGHPAIVPYLPDLVEAHMRAGSRDRALALLDCLDATATATGLAWPAAAAARCHGMLATTWAESEHWFDQAAAAHRRRSTPFEEARTHLCRGQAERRFRRPARARRALRSALSAFQALGTPLWEEQAATELAAAGGRPAVASGRRPLDQLTAQELQVARGIVRGLSNPEVAAALYVSRKTVEAHLTRVYRKLGVRSRTDLARVLVSAGFSG